MKNILNGPGMVTVVFSLLVMLGTAVAGGGEVTAVRPHNGDSGVFGDTQVSRVYRIEGPGERSAVLGWSLVADRRTLARGEKAFTIKPDGVVEVTVPITIAPVNEGVILQAELAVSVYGGDFNGEVAVHRRPLWIYPRDAFASRSHWLRSLDIVLFDPSGETAAVLDQAAVPYRRIGHPQELASGSGLAVVGEGLSIVEYPGLATAALTAAQRGTSVLWLSPAAGRFVLPGGSENDEAFPSAMTFRDLGIIAELDKRLDREIWTAPGRSPGTFAVRSYQQQVVVEVGAEGSRWSWLQVKYGEPEAELVVCGLPLIARWEDSPTPRFLLLRILEQISAP